MQKHRLAIMVLENAHAFARLTQPVRDDKARLERCMDENFSLLAPKDQQRIAAALATTPFIPRSVVRQILGADQAAAMTLLARSPAIDTAMLAGLIARHGAGDLMCAIARRPVLPAALEAQLRALDDMTINRALDRRQKRPVPAGTGPSLPIVAAPDTNAETAGKTSKTDRATVSTPAKHRTQIEDLIAARTGLGPQSVRLLCGDPTSLDFLHALRFVDLDTVQASTAFAAFSDPVMAGSASVMRRLAMVYDGISTEQAVQRVNLWRLEELRQLARRADNDAASQPSSASASRADTG